MERAVPLVSDETYHIFNRGAHKQPIFLDERDYLRFQVLLLLANSKEGVRIEDLVARYKTQGRSLRDVFADEAPDKSLVSILVYSLLPNHFHIVLSQKTDNGISTFMRKVATAYSMYFNKKYEHSGVLFQGRFKNSHIDNDPYYRWIFSYVHLNPIDLVEPGWKEEGIRSPDNVRKFISSYPYSSYADYAGSESRPERSLLAIDQAPDFLKQQNDLEDLLKWQSEFSKQGEPISV